MTDTTPSFNEEIEKFKKYLSEKKLRKTPERFEIIRCALSHGGHFDVDSLYGKMEENGYHVSRATIYSTLELMCACGIVRRLLFDTHQARYERASRAHAHLVCTECGDIREISIEGADGNLADMRFGGFTPAYFSTCIYGICDKCRKNKNE